MTPKPNFVIIVTDDQGYGDLSCLGYTDVATPHLDALCASGARLTDWYANGPVCSPTRAALLTGRYPHRTGVTEILKGHRSAAGLPGDVPTVATMLRERGYRSYLSGKWHLGAAEEFRPHRHGFDRWFGHLGGCVDYFSHIFYWGMNNPGPGINPVHDLWEDNSEVWHNGAYMTELITDRAIGYLGDAVRHGSPFLLYVAYNAPHYPMHAPQVYLERFSHLPWDRQVMAAMLAAADDGVGRIVAELDRLGLAEDTCIFFTSDNGPSAESRNWLDGTLDPYYGGSAGGFRGHKGSLFDGGIRVPGAVSWPGHIAAEQILTAPCATMDVAPTILTAADVDAFDCDGIDLMPYLTGAASPTERDLFFTYHGQLAIRRNAFKLVLDGAGAAEPVHLSNLTIDRAERTNIAAAHPELTAELTAAAHRLRGAQDPPNISER